MGKHKIAVELKGSISSHYLVLEGQENCLKWEGGILKGVYDIDVKDEILNIYLICLTSNPGVDGELSIKIDGKGPKNFPVRFDDKNTAVFLKDIVLFL